MIRATTMGVVVAALVVGYSPAGDVAVTGNAVGLLTDRHVDSVATPHRELEGDT